jgi:hypothetical protein
MAKRGNTYRHVSSTIAQCGANPAQISSKNDAKKPDRQDTQVDDLQSLHQIQRLDEDEAI